LALRETDLSRRAARSPRALSRLPAAPATRLRVGREVSIIALAAYLYFFVRGLVDGRAADAFRHAGWLIDLEQRLGIFWEPAIQAWALDHDPLVALANAIYIWGHWPVIVATLVWLLIAHPARFVLYRNALLASGAIGLVFFVTFPVAPPRFIEAWGFVDTITLHSHAYRVLQPPSLTNQYAALPSFHVGWNVLMGLAIASTASNRLLRRLALVMPAVMFAAVVLTANHYIVDGLLGSAIALLGLGVALGVPRHGSRRINPSRQAKMAAWVRSAR
jgi:hypothetical protein